jgi:hypothetical protein
MSSDYATAYDILSLALILAELGLLTLGALRAFQMSRGLVDATYRNRARWAASAASIIAIAIALANFLAPRISTAAADLLIFVTFAAGFIAMFAFADSTVLVTIQSDFFHRNILRWTRVRRPAWVAILACTAIDAALGGFTLFFVVFLVVIFTSVGYAAAALIVGARRTQDKTLKRHVKLLGWALAVLLPSAFLSTFGSSDVAANLISGAGFVVGFYVFYRALMSLTPLGHVEKHVTTIPKPGESGVIPPSHP